MKAYRIVNWVKFYEVDIDGHAVKRYEKPPPMEKLRKSPLHYIRFENTGHALTQVEQRINKKAWQPGRLFEMAVRGLYKELVKLAANQPREFRGWILDQNQRPLSIDGIAEVLGLFEPAFVREAVSFLLDTDIELLELCEFGERCAEVRTSPDECALFKNETETEKQVKSIERPQEFTISSSDSVSRTAVQRERQKAALVLAEVFRSTKKEDGTTFRDILDQLQRKVLAEEVSITTFDTLTAIAQKCGQGNIGMFVKAMKRNPFGYVPVRRPLLSKSKWE